MRLKSIKEAETRKGSLGHDNTPDTTKSKTSLKLELTVA